MQLWNAREADPKRLVEETRSLFILKRVATADDPPFEWTKRTVHVLSMSTNTAIAAEARRVDYSFDLPARRQHSAVDKAQDTVLWVSFSRVRS